MASTRRPARPDRAGTWRMLPQGEARAIQDIRDALIIRENTVFLLTDTDGSIPIGNISGLGLYHKDTRYLSGWDLSLIGVDPIVLQSTAELGFAMEQVMTNPELINKRGDLLPSGSMEIRRQRTLDGCLVETVTLTNFAAIPLSLTLQYEFAADFADIFELRGMRREARGRLMQPRVQGRSGVAFRYRGLDGVSRQTRLRFETKPDELGASRAVFYLEIPPGGDRRVSVTVLVDGIAGNDGAPRSTAGLHQSHAGWRESGTRVDTSNGMFNAAFERSIADLSLLWTEQDGGLQFVSAGVPWFDGLFGRDAALASTMSLMLGPQMARDVLRSLAHYQGQTVDLSREEEPGKIVHEVRQCEMANTGEVVFGRYYGSVDSTPLFLLLAAEYYRWTADAEFMRELLPHLDAALLWMDEFGDIDGDGYLEYIKRNPRGLDNQGWKDSGDAILDEEGRLLHPPIALVEVQGYAYAARNAIAQVYEALGQAARAQQLLSQALELRKRINRDFWVDDGYYAMALDAEKRPARVVSSNAGQLLWCGVPTEEKAKRLVKRITQNDMFSGWGIRTLASSAPRYNPLGYHLGTIWPHDNALIMAGMKRYGAATELNELATGLTDAAFSFPNFRLPELFSGSPRSAHQTPVPYPVACRPQAFAAAALPCVLAAILGLAPDAPNDRLYIVRPRLPFWLDFVRLSGLRVGRSRVDLIFHRRGSRTVAEVIGKAAPLEVVQVSAWPSRHVAE